MLVNMDSKKKLYMLGASALILGVAIKEKQVQNKFHAIKKISPHRMVQIAYLQATSDNDCLIINSFIS